jgi:hypothetical protein
MRLPSRCGVGAAERVNSPFCGSFGSAVGTVPAAPLSPLSEGAEGCAGACRELSSPPSPLDSAPAPDGFSSGPLNALPRSCNGSCRAVAGSLGVTFTKADAFTSAWSPSAGGRTESRTTIPSGKRSWFWLNSGWQITPANNEVPLPKDSKVPNRRTNWRVDLATIATKKPPPRNIGSNFATALRRKPHEGKYYENTLGKMERLGWKAFRCDPTDNLPNEFRSSV